MMNRRLALLAGGFMIFGLASATLYASGESQHTMYLTFNTPFALPGVALPAGTYIFERAEFTTPDIVRVMSRDGSHVYFTAFTRAISRPPGLPANRHVSFGEVAPGYTPPVMAWYPAGQSMGHQFIYPKNSAQMGATRLGN
jgi:hypothetical protein